MGQNYKVLIIGSGKIGAFFDNKESEKILTHAHAYYSCNGFEIVGFVDSDFKKAQMASQMWGGKSYSNIKEAFDENKIDVAVVATPDQFHFENLIELSKCDVKCVVAEKPLATNINDSNEILEKYKDSKISLVVNYSRRFVPEFEELKEKINNKEYGEFIGGSGVYGKGILHNGSHMIDLLRFLIGEVKDFKVLKSEFDFHENDPSTNVALIMENDSIFNMININHNYYTVFEMDLFFKTGRVKILNAGFEIEIYKTNKSLHFEGYVNLELSEKIATKLSKAQYYLAQNVYEYLENKKNLKCTLNDGVRALNICTSIAKEALCGRKF